MALYFWFFWEFIYFKCPCRILISFTWKLQRRLQLVIVWCYKYLFWVRTGRLQTKKKKKQKNRLERKCTRTEESCLCLCMVYNLSRDKCQRKNISRTCNEMSEGKKRHVRTYRSAEEGAEREWALCRLSASRENPHSAAAALSAQVTPHPCFFITVTKLKNL